MCIGTQLFVRPIIGLADNGDFAKVSGTLNLGTPNKEIFSHFISSYSYSPAYYRPPEIYSSETVVAWLARTLVRADHLNAHFGIGYLGAIHTLLFLGGFYVALCLLRQISSRTVQMVSALLFLWIFTDVMYVAYFNSFYTETVALVTLPVLVMCALYTAADASLWTPVIFFFLATLLFVTSKAQHTLLGIFSVLLLALLPLTKHRRARRVFGILAAVAVLVVMARQISLTPTGYSGYSAFDVIFVKIAPHLPDRERDWKLLGLVPADQLYVGKHAWVSGVPIGDPVWREQFLSRSGYPRVAQFYLHHPSYPLSFMLADLRTQAGHLRPIYLSNYRIQDKIAPFQLTKHFDSWSELRANLYRIWPEHIIVWYFVFMASAVTLILRGHTVFVKRAALIALCLAIAGIMEFSFASLMDSEQTDRHLILFHEITDLTIWLAVTASMLWGARRQQRHSMRQS